MDQAYFVIIAGFLSVFGTAYTYLSYRNKERLALIDAGFSPDMLNYIADRNGRRLVTVGLVFIGIAVGTIVGFYFEQHLLANHNSNNYRSYPQAYLTMIPLFIGTALIAASLINRRRIR
jgi:hypothetical protein